MPEYAVIYEHSHPISGFYKNRFVYYYPDESRFRIQPHRIAGTEIVAQGEFSPEDVSKLLSLVPEICVYTAAIEKLFENRAGILTLRQIGIALLAASETASEKRAVRRRFSTDQNDVTFLAHHLRLLGAGSRDKNILMKAVILAHDLQADRMNQDLLNLNIIRAYASLQF